MKISNYLLFFLLRLPPPLPPSWFISYINYTYLNCLLSIINNLIPYLLYYIHISLIFCCRWELHEASVWETTWRPPEGHIQEDCLPNRALCLRPPWTWHCGGRSLQGCSRYLIKYWESVLRIFYCIKTWYSTLSIDG